MKILTAALFILCLFTLKVKPIAAQSFPDLKFSHLTIKDGLSTHATKHIYEDRQGIIWIATSQGLNRYDGTGIKVFRNNKGDSTSICSDYLRYITEDDEGHLWIGSARGLSRFNPKTGKAVNYLHNPNNQNSLASNDKCNPFIDSRKRLWVATSKGVQLLDYKRNKFTTYTVKDNNGARKHEDGNVDYVREDAQHRLWAMSPYGLYFIDEATKSLRYHEQTVDAKAKGWHAIARKMYVSSIGGDLAQFDANKGKYLPVEEKLFSRDQSEIYDLQDWKDNLGQRWLCVATVGGLALIHPQTAAVKEYNFNRDNPTSLNAFAVFSITKDKQNRLWLATDNGVSIIDPNLQNFENLHLYKQIQVTNPRDFGLPNNILQTGDRNYITGFYGKGIYVLDKAWQLLEHHPFISPDIGGRKNISVNSILQDDDGTFWFSTDLGLVRKNGKSVRVFIPGDTTNGRIENAAVSKMYRRTDGLFWMRARSNGVYLFDPKKEQFISHFLPDGESIKGAVFSCLLDKKQVLWLGCVDGISRYNVAKNTFENIKVRKNGKLLSTSWVTDITEDKHGTVWAVANNGLIKINPKTLEANLLDKTDGMPEDNLKRILADTLGNLWIPSQQGLIKYDGHREFTYFNVNNGLPYQYEGYGFFEKEDESHFILGFNGIVTRFNPYRVKTNTEIPNIVWLEVVADGKELLMTKKENNQIISIDPGTKIINIHFAITNYTIPSDNQYFYRLGAGQWEQVNGGNIALGSLPHNTYQLEIKGRNNDGVWSRIETVSLIVAPFWYETWWFKFAMLLLISLAITFFVRRRIAVVRKEASFKQKITETEMQLMRSQMNPHFVFNCLNSIKLLAAENKVDAATDYLDRFARLIRLVLENSTSAKVPIAKEVETLRLYLQMEMIRFKEKLKYELTVSDTVDQDYMEILPMLIQPFVENAIWHGLMQKEEGGQLWVDIDYKVEQHCMIAVIKDNGIGRAKAAEIKSKSVVHNKSFGTKISEDRILLMNEMYNTNASVTITDLYGIDGKPAGTKVVLSIPVAEESY